MKIENPEVAAMVARIMKEDGMSEAEVIAYMLRVATGRIRALRKYTETTPAGKTSKGVYVAKKKTAPRGKPVATIEALKAKTA